MIVIPNRGRLIALMSALALAGGLLTLALLGKPAQTQAETITDNFESTWTKTFISCTGEEVLIEGTTRGVAHTTTDETGVLHTQAHVANQGQGVSASGAKYVFHETFDVSDNNSLSGGTENYNSTFIDNVKLIRQGSATSTDDQEYRFFGHVTINENGDLTVLIEEVEAVCT